jgi:hypothetical protein
VSHWMDPGLSMMVGSKSPRTPRLAQAWWDSEDFLVPHDGHDRFHGTERTSKHQRGDVAEAPVECKGPQRLRHPQMKCGKDEDGGEVRGCSPGVPGSSRERLSRRCGKLATSARPPSSCGGESRDREPSLQDSVRGFRAAQRRRTAGGSSWRSGCVTFAIRAEVSGSSRLREVRPAMTETGT